MCKKKLDLELALRVSIHFVSNRKEVKTMYEILKNIDSPADVKKLSADELENLLSSDCAIVLQLRTFYA